MKPLKRVVHVLHAFSTNLGRRVVLVGSLFFQTLLPKSVPHEGNIRSFCHPAPRTSFSVSMRVSF